MSLPQHVVLRYRAEGHLRFALPAVLCQPQQALRIENGLRAVDGVYRVDLYGRQGKLSIRYLSTDCEFSDIVRRLYELVRDVPVPSPASGRALAPLDPPADPPSWMGEKLQELRETAAATGVLAKRAASAISSRPQWVTDFLNDLLMLYLIKTHWESITQLWLKNPWRHRYEWAATLYLIHLLVRSKIPPPPRA